MSAVDASKAISALSFLGSFVDITGLNKKAADPSAPLIPEPSIVIQQVQDPIGVAIKVALLFDADPGTKLSFGPHTVDLQPPGMRQSVTRTVYGQSHNEVIALKSLLPIAIHLLHAFPEAPKKRIFTHVILGLDALAKTYEKEAAVKTILDELKKALESKISKVKKNDAVDNSPFYNKVKEIWLKHAETVDVLLHGKTEDTKQKADGKEDESPPSLAAKEKVTEKAAEQTKKIEEFRYDNPFFE